MTAQQPALIEDTKPAAAKTAAAQAGNTTPKPKKAEKTAADIDAEISEIDDLIVTAAAEIPRLREARGDALARGAADKEVDRHDGEIRLAQRNLERLSHRRAGLVEDLANARERERLAIIASWHSAGHKAHKALSAAYTKLEQQFAEVAETLKEVAVLDDFIDTVNENVSAEDGFAPFGDPDNVPLHRAGYKTPDEHVEYEKYPLGSHRILPDGRRVDASTGQVVKPVVMKDVRRGQWVPPVSISSVFRRTVLPQISLDHDAVWSESILAEFKWSDEFRALRKSLGLIPPEGRK